MRRTIIILVLTLLSLGLFAQLFAFSFLMKLTILKSWEAELKTSSRSLEREFREVTTTSSLYELLKELKEERPELFQYSNTLVIVLESNGFIIYSSYPSIENFGISWGEILDQVQRINLLEKFSPFSSVDRSSSGYFQEVLEKKLRIKWEEGRYILTTARGITMFLPLRSKLTGKTLGYVILYKDLTPLLNTLRRVTLLSLGFLLGLLLLTIPLSAFLTDRILSPLRSLKELLESLIKGEPLQESSLRSYPEIEAILKPIKELSLELNARKEELREQKESLELLLRSLPLKVILKRDEVIYRYGTIPDDLMSAVTSSQDPLRLLQYENKYFEVRHINLKGMQVWTIRDVTEERNKEKIRDEVLGILSHELRTPLTTIKGFILTLENVLEGVELPSHLQPNVTRAFRYLKREIERISDMIQELLTLAKLRLRRLKLRKTLISLDELKIELEEIVNSLTPEAERKGLKLRFNLKFPGSSEVFLSLDLDKFKQVVYNLLDNALRHAETFVELNLSLVGKMIAIEVKNDGERLSPKQLLQMFEKYVSSSEGLGLGLAISKEIVELHGGRIQAENWERGVSIKVFLPLTYLNSSGGEGDERSEDN